MKKVLLVLTIMFYCFTTLAQGKMTREQARLICAQEMAAFTKAVSELYQKGNSFEQFQFALCGNLKPAPESSNQLKAAYNFLSQNVSGDAIIKTYPGKEIAISLKYLADLHEKGIDQMDRNYLEVRQVL